jgi:hypothetical protein
MKIKSPELVARAKAYSALSKAYEADPAQRMFVDQVRRDTEAAHKWLRAQGNYTTKDNHGQN